MFHLDNSWEDFDLFLAFSFSSLKGRYGAGAYGRW